MPTSGRTYAGQTQESYCLECLVGKTRIYTANSVYPIARLRGNYAILTKDCTHASIEKFIARRYNGELLSVNTYYTNIPLKITPEHPILILRNARKLGTTWKKNLSFEDEDLEWVNAGELTERDLIAFPRLKTTIDANVVSPDLCELMGWYLSEGSLTPCKRGINIQFSLGKHEKENIARVMELIRKCYGVEPSISEKRTAIVITLSSKFYGPFFEQFGRKAEKKRIPSWVLHLPRYKQWRILRGMILGDGHIAFQEISYTTTSTNLAYELRLMLYRLGIPHGVYLRKAPKTKIEGRSVKAREPYHVRICGDGARVVAKNIGIDYEGSHRHCGIFSVVGENFILNPIHKINKTHFRGAVYNLHLNGGETYLTIHGVLHNCATGHTMTALTEMRHAIDRCRSSDAMTVGVQEKVRNALGELMGITQDVQDLAKASPEVRKGLTEILDEVRWIRKETETVKGLTFGHGTCKDLIGLRNRIKRLQDKAYHLLRICPTCTITYAQTPSKTRRTPYPTRNPKKSLNKQNTNPITRVGERKMVTAKDVATDSLMGFVAGTGGAAIHFLGFAPYFDQYTIAGVPGGAIVDILVGIVSVAAGNYVRQDWLKNVLMLLGGTLIGLGVGHAAGWTAPPAPPPVLGARAPVARQPVVAPAIF